MREPRDARGSPSVDSGDDRFSTIGVGRDWALIPGPASALIDSQNVDFVLEDIQQAMPEGPFDLILCRNLIFTYFDEAVQRRLTGQLHDRLLPGGYLVLGGHEAIPGGAGGFARLAPNLPIFRCEPPSP